MMKKHSTMTFPGLQLLLWVLLLCAFSNVQAESHVISYQTASEISHTASQQQLAILKAKNRITQQNLQALRDRKKNQLENISPKDVSEGLLTTASLEVANASANVNETELSIVETQRTLDAVNAMVTNLKERLQNAALLAASTGQSTNALMEHYNQEIANGRRLIALEKERLQALASALDLSQQTLTVEEAWYNHLQMLYQVQKNQARKIALNNQITNLQEQQHQWFGKLAQLNAKMHQTAGPSQITTSQQFQLQMEILEASEKSSAIHIQMLLLQIKDHLHQLRQVEEQGRTVAAFSGARQSSKLLLDNLQRLHSVLTQKVTLLEQRGNILNESKNSGLINETQYQTYHTLIRSLVSTYENELVATGQLINATKTYQAQLKLDLSKELGRRQGLPGFSLNAWEGLAIQIIFIPNLLYKWLGSLASQIHYSFQALTLWKMAGLLSLAGFWFVIWRIIGKILGKVSGQVREKRHKIRTNIFFIALELLRRNLTFILLALAIFTILFMGGLSFNTIRPLIFLMVIAIFFKLIIDLAKLSLVETSRETSRHDLQLFRAFKWAFILGGVLTALTYLVHQLPVVYDVRDFFNRVFMVFLLAISLLLLGGWRIVPHIFDIYVQKKRPYLRTIVRILSLLIPLSLLSTAMIGLLGYVDLAWAINKHEGIFLLVLCGYLLARGILIDIVEWLSEMMIRRVKNGWLWTQALLKPLDTVLRIALVILGIMGLFSAYSWGPSSKVVIAIENTFNYPLFNLAGSVITLLSLIKFIIVVSIFYWGAKWSREFAYRWLFAKSKDAGLRNSFAIFTQYIVVIIGFFVLLRVLGISFTGLAAIMTGFAIGIAFGLRDLFKNYVNGIMLLLERPLRSGDLVSIGNYEGKVTFIGARSINVSTWDNMEVVVPNSEIFDKPFTNWTLQDNIVRTIISVKISRSDDPHYVSQLAMDVMTACEAIVSNPEPAVFFNEIDDVLVEIDLRYFINLQATPSRAKVRSEVLFALWDSFKFHNIKTPYPAQEVQVKGLRDENE